MTRDVDPSRARTADLLTGGLTPKQIDIITENRSRPPAEILNLPGMEKVGVWQVTDFLDRISENPHAALANLLEKYIQTYGLPAKYGPVIAYIQYLRSRKDEQT